MSSSFNPSVSSVSKIERAPLGSDAVAAAHSAKIARVF